MEFENVLEEQKKTFGSKKTHKCLEIIESKNDSKVIRQIEQIMIQFI